MEDKRFASIAIDWGVQGLVDEYAASDTGVEFVRPVNFQSVDWMATSLKLARQLQKEAQEVDRLYAQNIDLVNAVDEQKGRVEGRDNLALNQQELLDEASKLQSAYAVENSHLRDRLEALYVVIGVRDRLEALYVVIGVLGDRIHDMRENRDT
jgi:ABC-type phosphate transport system auxiliary subunit